MPFFYYYDPYYWMILVPAMLIALLAQLNVSSTFNRYSRMASRRGFTGAQAAEAVLRAHGIQNVRIERVSGRLTDHYDPRSNVIRLSDAVYGSNSIASVGVAAHEAGLVKIKAVYPTIEALSNDELRAHSSNLKKQIANFIAADEARIVELKARLELPDTSLSDKEKISKEIDETVKRIDEKIEQKLDELLPEAFAIMKDTARRFAQNETVEVTANDFDRELAATKD